jgi:hypothetical protein
MSLHIQRFLDRIRAAESRSQRDVIMTVAEARDLHHEITRILARLEQSIADANTTPVIEVNLDGGSFR